MLWSAASDSLAERELPGVAAVGLEQRQPDILDGLEPDAHPHAGPCGARCDAGQVGEDAAQ
jgi:hypothetical protein